MKVLFLDIDGVVNSAEYFRETDFTVEPETYLEYYYRKIDPQLVARLNRILSETGAKVVISSSWRVMHSKEDILFMLQQRGFAGDIIDVTLRLTQDTRGDEIRIWLENTRENIESFVILDDDSDMANLGQYHVHTTWEKGLQDEHVEKAVSILNGGQT